MIVSLFFGGWGGGGGAGPGGGGWRLVFQSFLDEVRAKVL